jgi:hypothetical protein
LPPARQHTQLFPVNFRNVIPQLANDVQRLLDNPSFSAFSTDLGSSAHGAVHVRVGGEMLLRRCPRMAATWVR